MTSHCDIIPWPYCEITVWYHSELKMGIPQIDHHDLTLWYHTVTILWDHSMTSQWTQNGYPIDRSPWPHTYCTVSTSHWTHNWLMVRSYLVHWAHHDLLRSCHEQWDHISLMQCLTLYTEHLWAQRGCQPSQCFSHIITCIHIISTVKC